MTARRSSLIATLGFLAFLAACRPMAIESEPGPVYSIEVYNSLPSTMIVSFMDDRGSHELGTVGARARQRFIVAGASDPTVTITARSEGETRTARPKTVTLRAGQTLPVTLE